MMQPDWQNDLVASGLDQNNPLDQELLLIMGLIKESGGVKGIIKLNRTYLSKEKHEFKKYVKQQDGITLLQAAEQLERMRWNNAEKRENYLFRKAEKIREGSIVKKSGKIFYKPARVVSQRAILRPQGSFDVRLDYEGYQYVRAISLWQVIVDVCRMAQVINEDRLPKEVLGEIIDVNKNDDGEWESAYDVLGLRGKNTARFQMEDIFKKINTSTVNMYDGLKISTVLTDRDGKIIAVSSNDVSDSISDDNRSLGFGEIRMEDIIPEKGERLPTLFESGDISLDSRLNIINKRRSICSEQKVFIEWWLRGMAEGIGNIYLSTIACNQCRREVLAGVGISSGKCKSEIYSAGGWPDEFSKDLREIAQHYFKHDPFVTEKKEKDTDAVSKAYDDNKLIAAIEAGVIEAIKEFGRDKVLSGKNILDLAAELDLEKDYLLSLLNDPLFCNLVIPYVRKEYRRMRFGFTLSKDKTRFVSAQHAGGEKLGRLHEMLLLAEKEQSRTSQKEALWYYENQVLPLTFDEWISKSKHDEAQDDKVTEIMWAA
jgi:hypothetical protein